MRTRLAEWCMLCRFAARPCVCASMQVCIIWLCYKDIFITLSTFGRRGQLCSKPCQLEPASAELPAITKRSHRVM